MHFGRPCEFNRGDAEMLEAVKGRNTVKRRKLNRTSRSSNSRRCRMFQEGRIFVEGHRTEQERSTALWLSKLRQSGHRSIEGVSEPPAKGKMMICMLQYSSRLIRNEHPALRIATNYDSNDYSMTNEPTVMCTCDARQIMNRQSEK